MREVLLVEDEKELGKSIQDFLSDEGYKLKWVQNYFDAEDALLERCYDCVVLDINLPDGTGIELLKWIKKQELRHGILMISAKNTVDDKIVGLETGADDYLAKPFHLAELNARIHAILRRRQGDGQDVIKFNEIEVHTDLREVRVAGRRMCFTNTEFDVAKFLIVNRNKVITKRSIADHIWDEEMGEYENFDFLYTHIKNFRKKVKMAGGKDYLKTVYGIGYKYCD